jgi:hypothetical protein
LLEVALLEVRLLEVLLLEVLLRLRQQLQIGEQEYMRLLGVTI